MATKPFWQEIDDATGRPGNGELLSQVFFKPPPQQGVGMFCAQGSQPSYAEVSVTGQEPHGRLQEGGRIDRHGRGRRSVRPVHDDPLSGPEPSPSAAWFRPLGGAGIFWDVAIETTDAAAAGTVGLGGDLQVRRLGYGAMRITGDGIWGPPKDRDAAIAVLRRAVELGVNFIDTADSYGPEVSEELIAEALHPYPGGLVIATKGGLTRSGPSRWERDGRPEHLREACEGSLRRLRVERIDVYQLHAVDPEVPLEESVGTLVRAARRGQDRPRRRSPTSTRTSSPGPARSSRSSRSRTATRIGDRVAEPVLEVCERDGIAFIPWFPLASGGLDAEGAISRIADAHDATPFQVALAWLLARSPVMLPIPGTSSVAHLEENVAAASLRLTEDEFAELSALAE